MIAAVYARDGHGGAAAGRAMIAAGNARTAGEEGRGPA